MDYRILKVIVLIRDDLSKQLTLDKLAQAVDISPSRLRHLFKDEVGSTPTRYLKDLRMKIARELLEKSSLRIKQVMINIGVNDESHFVRDFKRTFGMTPTQCRALYNSALIEKQAEARSHSLHKTG
jgi:AraC-like DNA-binding protein